MVIESQLAKTHGIREQSGAIERKPLKGRKVIKSGVGRIIPIFDKTVFNLLAKKYNEQLELLKLKKYGSDGKNYLFFDGFTRNTLNAALVKIYEDLNIHIFEAINRKVKNVEIRDDENTLIETVDAIGGLKVEIWTSDFQHALEGHPEVTLDRIRDALRKSGQIVQSK